MKKTAYFILLCILTCPCLLAICSDSIILVLIAIAYGYLLYQSGLFAKIYRKTFGKLNDKRVPL